MKLIAFLLLFSFSLPGMTQNFAHLNVDEVLYCMPEYDSAQLQMTRMRDEMQKVLQEKILDYEKLTIKYQDIEHSDTTEEFKAMLIQNIKQEEMRIQEMQQYMEVQLIDEEKILSEQIRVKLMMVIKAYAADNLYDWVFDSGSAGVLITPSSKDITSNIKALLCQ